MEIGPVEYLVVEFPGNEFNGEIAPEIAALAQAGIVRILDLVFITKDENGDVVWLEADAMQGEVALGFLDSFDQLQGLLNEDDIATVAAELAPNSSAGLILWENTWAARLAGAIENAKGRVVAHERIPREFVLEAAAALTS
ncbi:MAG: DUF6325 family protein [Actinomycetota bacterium]|nr:DUF6325 family protein [Actinomycetota bacterium]MDP2288101.1 DUF6325 family protein [Actinomycetota bacterium]